MRQVFEGKKVVSTRACEHIRMLGQIAQGGLDHNNNELTKTESVLLLIVNRGDARFARPCVEACPVWAEEVRAAIALGVRVVVVGIHWDGAEAKFNGVLPFLMDTS